MAAKRISKKRKGEIALTFCRHILLSIYRNRGDADDIVNQLVDETDSALMKMLDENSITSEELKLFLYEEIMKLKSKK